MNARGRWSVFFGLVTVGSLLEAGSGCGGDPGGPGGGGTGGTGGTRECAPAPAPQPPKEGDKFGDDDSHWIVLDPTGACGPVSSWTGHRLFHGNVGNVESGGTMGMYCAYTWTGATPPTPPDVLLLPSPKARDRRAITPQTPTVESWAHDTFIHGITPPASAPAVNDPRVRVIVADTQKDSFGPGGPGVPGANRHGELMATLIRDVACPAGAPCAVEVETRLALPRRRSPTSLAEEVVSDGGDYGRLSDLVGAIDAALDHWRSELQGNNPFPEVLALNLSLAFEHEAPQPDEDFAADDIIRDALRAFSCHGGVTFAAAGNHGGQGSTGLMYPAAWQDLDEPSGQECKALLNSPSSDFHGTLKASYSAKTGGNALLRRPYFPNGSQEHAPGKLLHAIGAFDQGGVAIKKTRENGCPRFGALGLGWSVPGRTNFLLTGSSVPTAVVSAFFAASMAQDTFVGFQLPNFQDPYLNVHPQTILDELGKLSPKRAFGANGPCGKDWTCGDIPWIGAPQSPVTAQNDGSAFPSLDYSPGQPVAGQGEDNNCTVPPLCEQKAVSAISVLFPQPTDIPCLRGCVLSFSSYIFRINPAMDLQYVKLLIETSGSSDKLIDITTTTVPTLDANVSYSFTLPTNVVLSTSSRVSISAFDRSGNKVFNEQVMLVQ